MPTVQYRPTSAGRRFQTGYDFKDITKTTPYQVVDNPKLLTHFAQQCPDAALRKMILVDTPQRLYRFA